MTNLNPLTQDQKKELETDPDLVELVQDVAERIRVMLFEEDDEVVDRLEDITSNHFPDVFEEEHDRDFIVRSDQVGEVYLRMLTPLVHRVLDKGDWRDEG